VENDPRVLDHLAKLRIHFVEGKPCLLLHDWGGTVVDPRIVRSVFDFLFTSYLINTRGSGKTRVLFEGLLKNLGLSHNQILGSQDMSYVLEDLPSASDFTMSVDSALNPHRTCVLNKNIGERRFCQVLTARLLVLYMFFEEARKVCPEGPLDRYPAHWLVQQLRPGDVVESDIFDHLTRISYNASDRYLGLNGFMPFGEARRLSHDIVLNYTSARLHLVIDEAQIPA
jgi:hypothetical protein